MKRETAPIVALLKACAQQKDLNKGNKIHSDIIIRHGLLHKDICIGSALVNVYARCGYLSKAQEVFDELRTRDTVSWNALIAGYAQHEKGEEALQHFSRMQNEGLSPNSVTFLIILKACGSMGSVDMKCKEIHAKILKQELFANDVCLGNALVDMYARCGALTKAHRVFNELPIRDTVSWNALISGYAQHRHDEEALTYFDRMKGEGYTPNAFTFVSILKACGSIKATEKGTEIYAVIMRAVPLMETNVLVGAALINMYSKCDAIMKAQEICDQLAFRNVVPWNALIAGYVQNELGEEALKCFECMRYEGIHPNSVTFLSVTKACSIMGAAGKGIEVHKEIIREGLSEKGRLGNALVDMYAKCGLLPKAKEVFEKLNVRDVVAWTSLISGYAQFGTADIVVTLFDSMIREEVKPSLVTFTVVLNACSHGGLLDKGPYYFDIMSNEYGFVPTLEHHTCMIDLFGRAGHFDKALTLINGMPISDYIEVWTTLLGACRKWGNVKLGRMAFEHAIRLDQKCISVYICMWNIYVGAGMHGHANKIEAMRIQNGAGQNQNALVNLTHEFK